MVPGCSVFELLLVCYEVRGGEGGVEIDDIGLRST